MSFCKTTKLHASLTYDSKTLNILANNARESFLCVPGARFHLLQRYTALLSHLKTGSDTSLRTSSLR